MPEADFFAKLGVFVARDFLDPAFCEQIIRETGSADQARSEVVDGQSSTEKLKPAVRQSSSASVRESTASGIYSRLKECRSRLENHFNMELTGCEKPQFLTYVEGDFFRPHTDSDTATEKPEYVRKRKLSVVVFMNDEASENRSGKLVGGSLILYGLINDPRWQTYGFPVVGEPGLMIAFRSEIVHEVTPVIRGRRFSIVSWFF